MKIQIELNERLTNGKIHSLEASLKGVRGFSSFEHGGVTRENTPFVVTGTFNPIDVYSRITSAGYSIKSSRITP